jgi:hypothetical protein
LQITERNGEEEASYVFEYNEDGSLSYLKLDSPEGAIESVENSFVDGLPTELTMTYEGDTFAISINWEEGTAEVTLNGVTETDTGGMIPMLIGMVAMIGDSYEVVTLDNVTDLIAF